MIHFNYAFRNQTAPALMTKKQMFIKREEKLLSQSRKLAEHKKT